MRVCVLHVHRHALCVDGTEVGVLKKANQVGLGSLLERNDSRGLEPQIRLEVRSNLADEALEGEFADQQLRGLLVAANLAQRHSAWAVAVRLLDAAGCGVRLGSPWGLDGELLAGGLASRGFACGLLGACHGLEGWEGGG